MPLWKPKGLYLPYLPPLIMPFAGWYPCCGGLTCPLCLFENDRPTEWIADLGVGGWVNASCDYCDQIGGEYTMPRWELPVCVWSTGEIVDVCTTAPFGYTPYLKVVLSHNRVAPESTEWRWRVFVQLHHADVVYSHAYYVTDFTEDSDCWFFGGQDDEHKIELTKLGGSEVHAGGLCTGNLPNTIHIWVPA